MRPTRSKSAASYRVLGAKTPSCSTHSSLEYEYNFVRKVIDVMSTYPSGHSGQAGSVRSLRPSTGAPSLFQRRYTLPIHNQAYTTRPHTKKNSTLHLIEVGELFNGLGISGSPQRKKMTAMIRAFECPIDSCLEVDQQGYRLGNRRIIFGSPNFDNMAKKTFVLPVTSFAHSRLQLTGDVMKIYKSRPSSRETRDSRKGVMASTYQSSKDVTKDFSFRKGQFYSPSPMIYKVQSQGGLHKTDLVRHVVGENKSTGIVLTMKDLAGKPKTPDLKNGFVKLSETVPKFALKGTKQEIKRSQSFLPDSRTPRNIISKSQSTNNESAIENVKKDNMIADNGIEGKTEMSNGSGTLTLSIFLPRENEDLRLCHRKELTCKGPEIDRHSGYNFESADSTQNNPGQNFHENDVVNDNDEQNGVYSVKVSNIIGHTMEQSSSRALHCELFGPELCGDCRLCKEREDEQAYQEQEYPDISTNPRQMVAAPLLRYGTLFKSYAAKSYSGQPMGSEGDSTPINDRNLNSVVTQNEIRSRIIAAASSTKFYN